MKRYLIIAITVAAVCLLLPVFLKGITVTTPVPNQTVAQRSDCFGLIVSNSCNNTSYMNAAPPTDFAGIAGIMGWAILGLAPVLVLWLIIWHPEEYFE
jgi:glucan phosphoethanolaminetransferase (alkaline phosphatase superfamily)